MKFKTVWRMDIVIHDPQRGDMPQVIGGATEKLLDRRAAVFAKGNATIKYDTKHTVQIPVE